MQIQIGKSQIIKQFKRNGFNLDSISIKYISQFLNQSKNQSQSLKGLLKKINELSINSQQKFTQKMVKIAIQIIEQGSQNKFKSFDQVVQDLRKWAIMYISPYQYCQSTFFKEKPEMELFKFDPQQKMKNDIKRFKQIQENAKQQLKSSDWFIGMLYEDFSKSSTNSQGSRSKIILQNQANELQIIFPHDYVHKYSLVPGCIYAVRGKYLTKGLSLTVSQLALPPPLSQQKTSLIKQKFKLMCQNINSSKNDLSFQVKDFYKYSTLLNQKRDLNKQTLIFGAVQVTKDTLKRILSILSQLNNQVECIVLMLDQGQHQEVDFKIWFKDITVFVIPHVNSQGPRLLPKVPIMKSTFNATKILTNPAKFSYYLKQAMFLNTPLMKNIYQKNILHQKQVKTQLNQQQMARCMSQLLFSQGTISFIYDIYPKQNDYFKLKQDTILFVSDKACPFMEHSKEKKCQFVSVGNFHRNGQFVCYTPKHKRPVQLCEEILG